MLVAISGSQGSGKSTILGELEKRGFSVVRRKSSRSILSEWGVTLHEVNNDPELTLRFQQEIIERKQQDEADCLASAAGGPSAAKTVVFTERTYADLFTYALIAIGKDNCHSDWTTAYYSSCMTRQQTYDAVFYLPAGMFKVAHDGVRGSNTHYSKMVDLTMLEFTKQMTHPSRLNVIETSDLNQRVDIITHQVLSFVNKIN